MKNQANSVSADAPATTVDTLSESASRTMQSGPFTPGPWVVWTEDESIGSVATVNGTPIAQAQATKPLAYPGPDHERKANARLIAAAPDLLAALTELVACKDLQHRYKTYDPQLNWTAEHHATRALMRDEYERRKPLAWAYARAAIAKATS